MTRARAGAVSLGAFLVTAVVSSLLLTRGLPDPRAVVDGGDATVVVLLVLVLSASVAWGGWLATAPGVRRRRSGA